MLPVRDRRLCIPRLPWDDFFMLQAHLAATRSTCDRGPELLFNPKRHGVGAVLVKEHRIIGGGYNGSPPNKPHCNDVGHEIRDGHCVRTIHAERNALHQCAIDGNSPIGASLYVTASPCYDCAKDLVRVGVKHVFFGQPYESRYGLSSDVQEFLFDAGIQTVRLVLSLDIWLEDR